MRNIKKKEKIITKAKAMIKALEIKCEKCKKKLGYFIQISWDCYITNKDNFYCEECYNKKINKEIDLKKKGQI